MGIMDYFRPVPTITAADLRQLLRQREPEDYSLVDVRQPAEYEKGHLPGARLIPVGALPERLFELDAEKTTIAY